MNGAAKSAATTLPSVAAGIRLRVLLPLAATLLLLLLAFVGIFALESSHHQREDIARTAAAVEMMFREQSAAGIQVMRSVMEPILQDRRLATALRAGDRQALFALSAPLLEQIKVRNHISHFYYILPDRTMLLRVAAPDKHGDRIDRFVLLEAQRTGKPSWGNEQGPLGSFTLRVTYPWYDDGDLIGYLEMGIEFEDIMENVKKVLGVDVFVAINKSYFNHEKWNEAQARRPHPVSWNEFPAVVVISRTTPAIPPPILDYLRAMNERHDRRSFETAWDGGAAETIALPFANLRGEQLGELVVLRDITMATAHRRRMILAVAILGMVIGGGLMVFFNVLLGRVQRDIADRSATLAEVQRVLTVEQLERQRAERELTMQQERNDLLEGRGRMVEELAAAKEAAESALRENERITAELRAAQGQLVAAARQAGMAEIATNVLHNVGNVLNSVNISAGLVGTRVHTSKAEGLVRAARMLQDHAHDLAAFLTRDEKGKRLPEYISKIADALMAERESIVGELRHLTGSIEHIRDVVAAQQSYAGTSRIDETIQVRDVVENALRLSAAALARHDVTVVREFAEVAALPLDRHRILQILVNLISNASYAMDGNDERPRRLTVAVKVVDRAEGGRLRISVADEGHGIAAENIERVFSHGFTTRKNGHGFGLHSCALAARELGGTLTAHSDGPGRGAVFTLELPIAPQGRAAGRPDDVSVAEANHPSGEVLRLHT